MRDEALEVLYNEVLFEVMISWPKQKDEYMCAWYQYIGYCNIDMTRVRHCHRLSHWSQLPPTGCSGWWLSGYGWVAESEMEHYSTCLAQRLASTTHHMQHLLIEYYYFEIAELDGRTSGIDLRRMLGPLEVLRGIKAVYIRILNEEVWPYVRRLERLMMSERSAKVEDIDDEAAGGLVDPGVAVEASAHSEILEQKNTTAVDLFELFDRSPLYEDREKLVRELTVRDDY